MLALLFSRFSPDVLVFELLHSQEFESCHCCSNDIIFWTRLTQLQQEYRECSIMYFMKLWLHKDIPDSVVSLNGFTLLRADQRMTESGKRKSGVLVVFINNKWCNSGHVVIKERHSSRDKELLAVSTRPYYLSREVSHMIMLAVYIPLSADAAAAAKQIQSTMSRHRKRSNPPPRLSPLQSGFSSGPTAVRIST